MRILLDECVPAPMQSLLSNHACTTVQAKGWSGIRNGDLLQRAEAEFDLFITSDQNIRYQQNLAGRSIAILELSTNDIARIRAAASILDKAVASIQPNAFQHLDIP
jgi:predicted nuclease of predicted toxin-antitoxin system